MSSPRATPLGEASPEELHARLTLDMAAGSAGAKTGKEAARVEDLKSKLEQARAPAPAPGPEPGPPALRAAGDEPGVEEGIPGVGASPVSPHIHQKHAELSSRLAFLAASVESSAPADVADKIAELQRKQASLERTHSGVESETRAVGGPVVVDSVSSWIAEAHSTHLSPERETAAQKQQFRRAAAGGSAGGRRSVEHPAPRRPRPEPEPEPAGAQTMNASRFMKRTQWPDQKQAPRRVSLPPLPAPPARLLRTGRANLRLRTQQPEPEPQPAPDIRSPPVRPPPGRQAGSKRSKGRSRSRSRSRSRRRDDGSGTVVLIGCGALALVGAVAAAVYARGSA